jgi:hypothetical protein
MIAHSGARARRQHKSAQREFLCNSAAEATAMSKGYVAIRTDRQTDRHTDTHTQTHISEVTLQFPVTLFGEDSTNLLQGGKDFEGVLSTWI